MPTDVYIAVGDRYRYHVLYHTPTNTTRIVLSCREQTGYSPVEVISLRGLIKERIVRTLVEQEIERMGRSC